MTAAEYHTIDLGRLDLRSGQGRRIELALAIQPVDQGGNRYEVDGGTVEARIDVSRTATGFALRLRFGARITGPCVRCLEPASIEVEVDAREVDQPRTDDEELRSPYVDEEILDLGAWAHDALAARPAAAAALPPRLRRPLPGVRRVAQRRRSGRPRTRHGRRSALGEAPRAARLIPHAPRPWSGAPLPSCADMAVPKKRQSSTRRDKRRATHKAAKPRLNECPRCHSPRLPAPRLPRLRHVRRARGDLIRDRRRRSGLAP